MPRKSAAKLKDDLERQHEHDPQITRAFQRNAMRPSTLDPRQDYSIDEAAILLCSSRSGVYRLVREGLLTLKKRGRRSRIAGAQIIAANGLSTGAPQ